MRTQKMPTRRIKASVMKSKEPLLYKGSLGNN